MKSNPVARTHTATDAINCLQCQHARLLPHTDVTADIIPIFCGKSKRPAPAFIETLCDIADPRPRYQPNKNGHMTKQGGDRTSRSTAFERRWLAYHYPRASWDRLTALTGRDRQTLLTMGHRKGWKRPELEPVDMVRIQKAGQTALRTSNLVFNDAQRQYIREQYEAGNWSFRGGNFSAAHMERRRAIQRELEAGVAARGRPFPWASICKHVQWTSPWYAKRQADKRARKRAQRKAVCS